MTPPPRAAPGLSGRLHAESPGFRGENRLPKKSLQPPCHMSDIGYSRGMTGHETNAKGTTMTATETKHDWATGWVMMRWSDLDPSFSGVTVLKSSEKAVCLLADGRDASAQWFPKSAFRMDRYGSYQPLPWFKAKMTKHQMKALGYMS